MSVPINYGREHAVQQFAIGILQRLPVCYPAGTYLDHPAQVRYEFEASLQVAIGGVLAGLEDAAQADLYARIVSGLEQGSGTLASLIEYEVRATQLWSAL